MICYNQDGLDALIQWGETSFIDGTFNVVEGGRILTLLMVRTQHDGEGFICAWMISDHRTTSVYSFFFSTILDATEHRWNPKYFILDFEMALRNAILNNFILVQIHLCYFHLKQSCKRFCQTNHIGKEKWCQIKDIITGLALAPTRSQFEQKLSEANVKMQVICISFWKHFSKYYIHPGCSFPIEYWTVFSKTENQNRTNNIVESKNKVIKKYLGEKISILNFIVRAKEYQLAQPTLIAAQKNTTWEKLKTPKKSITFDPQPIQQNLVLKFEVGDKVQGVWKIKDTGEMKLFSGQVIKLNPKTVKVLWEDGITNNQQKKDLILVEKKK